MYATDREAMVPAERYQGFETNMRRACRKQVVRYHLPFTGDFNLLKYMPSTRILWTQNVPVENGEVCFDAIVWHDDSESVKREWEEFLNSLRTQVGYSTSEVNAYNARLEPEVLG